MEVRCSLTGGVGSKILINLFTKVLHDPLYPFRLKHQFQNYIAVHMHYATMQSIFPLKSEHLEAHERKKLKASEGHTAVIIIIFIFMCAATISDIMKII